MVEEGGGIKRLTTLFARALALASGMCTYEGNICILTLVDARPSSHTCY